MTNEITWRKLVTETGARTDRYGPKLTMNLARASAVRCPRSGKLMTRDTDTFKRMEARLAPR